MSYTQEITDNMVARYKENPCRATVDELVKELDKPLKSVIGKLSREGVYQPETYKSKTGDTPITKLELARDIEALLGLDVEALEGIEKTPKLQLTLLLRTLENVIT